MKNSLMLCGLALSIFGTSFSAKSQTLSAHLRQKVEQENRILDQEVQKSLQSMHIRSDFRDASYATEDDGKIVLSTDLLSGDAILVKVSTPIPGPIPWADMNGNDQYDEGEELVGDYQTETKLTVKNSSITLYGDFYALKLPKAKITDIDVSKAPNLMFLLVPQNQISTIDLSKNSGLRFLQLSVNSLTSLDLSKNEEITTLAVGANQLSSIDLSRSSAMKKCWIYSNQISSIVLPPQFYSMADVDVSANYISGDLMDQIIKKLPNLQDSPQEGGVIVVIDTKEPTEQNVCYKSSAKEAKDKNWAVKNNNGDSDHPQDYAGTDKPVYAPIDGPSIELTTSTPMNESITIFVKQAKENENQVAWVDLNGDNSAETSEALAPGKNKIKVGNSSMKVYGNFTKFEAKKANITAIDLTKATALDTLNLFKNALTSLDLSKNVNLTDLDVANNALTALDLSNNFGLMSLNCAVNKLTSLDLSPNAALKVVTAYKNELTSISFNSAADSKLNKVVINSNKIDATEMAKIVKSLPARSVSDKAQIVVINTKDDAEGNVCTKSDVATAKGKNWMVKDFNGSYKKMVDYEGSTPKAASATPVHGKTKIIISTTSVKNQYEVQLPTSALHQTLRLFDLAGRQLLSLPITQQKMTINVNALPCGIYLMHINGQMQKIVKE